MEFQWLRPSIIFEAIQKRRRPNVDKNVPKYLCREEKGLSGKIGLKIRTDIRRPSSIVSPKTPAIAKSVLNLTPQWQPLARINVLLLLAGYALLSLCWFGIIVAVNLLVHDPAKFLSPECSPHLFIGLYPVALPYVLITPYFLFALRNIKGHQYIRTETALSLVTICIFMTLETIITFGQDMEHLNLGLGRAFWLLIFAFLDQLLTVIIPVCYSLFKRVDHGKMISKRNMESFEEVLEDPIEYKDFVKCLAESFSTENAVFYEQYRALCETFEIYKGRSLMEGRKTSSIAAPHNPPGAEPKKENERLYPSITDTEAREELLIRTRAILKNHFRSGAPYELNITSRTRNNVLKTYDEAMYPQKCNRLTSALPSAFGIRRPSLAHIQLEVRTGNYEPANVRGPTQNEASPLAINKPQDLLEDAYREVLLNMYSNTYPIYLRACSNSANP